MERLTPSPVGNPASAKRVNLGKPAGTAPNAPPAWPGSPSRIGGFTCRLFPLGYNEHLRRSRRIAVPGRVECLDQSLNVPEETPRGDPDPALLWAPTTYVLPTVAMASASRWAHPSQPNLHERNTQPISAPEVPPLR